MSLAPHRIRTPTLASVPALRPAAPVTVPRAPARLPRDPHRRGLSTLSAGVPALAALAAWPTPKAVDAALLLGNLLLWPWLVRGVAPGHLLHPGPSARGVASAAVRAVLVLATVAWLAGATLPPALLLSVVAATAVADWGLRALDLRVLGPREGTARGPARRVLLAGHDDATRRMADELARVGAGRVDVVGRCRATVEAVAAEASRVDAEDVVLLPCPHLSPARVRHLTWRLADQGRSLHVAPGLVGVGGARIRLEHHGGLSLVNLQHSELRSTRRSLLQGCGRVTALCVLVLLTPLLAVLTLAVLLDSPGPALFRQQRVGEHGRRFTMLKFRTMTHEAEPLTVARPDGQFLFKLQRDPRITRVGGLLRRYSLDELPQLINVVRGEMALVGPRPALPEETARYADEVHRRLAVRPGMTGLWQVSGRSDLPWEETVRLDLDYVDNWTPGLDLRILVRTVGAVLGHRGAY